jgi:hypothetical protein
VLPRKHQVVVRRAVAAAVALVHRLIAPE